MPDDIEAILARVEEELGEDARTVLENELPMDDEGNLPEDVREAMAGELKAAQKMAKGVDYAGDIADAYGRGSRETGLKRSRVPTGAGSGGASQKMEGDGSEPVDYAEDIAAAFRTGG